MTLGCKCCWDSPGLKLNSHQALAGLKKAKIEVFFTVATTYPYCLWRSTVVGRLVFLWWCSEQQDISSMFHLIQDRTRLGDERAICKEEKAPALKTYKRVNDYNNSRHTRYHAQVLFKLNNGHFTIKLNNGHFTTNWPTTYTTFQRHKWTHAKWKALSDTSTRPNYLSSFAWWIAWHNLFICYSRTTE